MARTNKAKTETTPGFKTYEGAPAVKLSAEKELRRTVACMLLFEDSFYETGSEAAARLAKLCEQVSIPFLCDQAIRARKDLKLRHAPLYLMVQALKKQPAEGFEWHRNMVGGTIAEVIQRADELAEILAIYWKLNPDRKGNKHASLPRQLKAGIAKAFPKFSAYNLGKYNRADAEVKLRDALFLSHAKPKDKEQAKTWKKLIDGKLESPDTWEVQLSAGKDKKDTFERLIREEKLGYMALLRNLRNMEQTQVDRSIVEAALLKGAEDSKALPFRFITAARYAPSYAAAVSDAMLKSLKAAPPLDGRTAIIVDGSNSMNAKLSEKTEISRLDAAGALAILLRETSSARVFVFSDCIKEVAAYRGLALIDGIRNAVPAVGTLAGAAVKHVVGVFKDVTRIIIVTDEQSADPVPHLMGIKGYIINVGTYAPALPSVGGSWTSMSGFSERLVEWIREDERVEG